ncbi:DNA topoisomerase 3 [Pokkaliibacter plantistimulans]|uniref:DNA topoisomerase 3 n=1 Tax=Pokkaliibacter plantistimulans TaxID=1635171 RepID=UPI000D74163A|nr:DNA topoisomerase 3 [Pokkaliibacter plantistimulans]
MRLYLCEKPSLAREVARALGGGQNQDGLIAGQGWQVTWLFGHMYELAPPDSYSPSWKAWRLDTLPMIPDSWQRLPRKGVSKQLSVIRGCLKQAREVVNAGDTGREGELLIRELLEEMNWRGPLFRLWHHSLELPVLQKALANLRGGSEFDGLLSAAKARQYSDWLVGMNFSRAYTVRARGGEQGKGVLISVGRVQSPTLALVVARDRLIENFASVCHYGVKAEFQIKAARYWGEWLAPEEWLDEQGHLLNPQLAQEQLARVINQPAHIESCEASQQRTLPPLPFSLSKLQAWASRRYGYPAKATLDALQSLYEKHKLLTYPRTDCEYLSSAQWADVSRQMQALSSTSELSSVVAAASTAKRPRCYDDGKIGEHTAIVPTGTRPELSRLSAMERNLYLACATRWLMQFYPPLLVKRWQVITQVNQLRFQSKGKDVLEQGWRALEGSELQSDWCPQWAELSKGDHGLCLQAEVTEHQTEPPDYYTDGTLIAAMAQIAKTVDDPDLRERLKEAKGIGEESSRAAIIELLLERTYLQRQGKQLRSTELGRQVIDWLLPQLTSPVLTARWERGLELVEKGEMDLPTFLSHQARWISKLIDAVRSQPAPQIVVTAQVSPKKSIRRRAAGKRAVVKTDSEKRVSRGARGEGGVPTARSRRRKPTSAEA